MSEDLTPEQYREILENLPNGVYVVDPDRKITFWNDGAERITGYLRQEVIGRRCPDTPLKHCDLNYVNICETACPLEATARDGQAREINVYVCHRSGRHVPVHVRASAVRDETGHIVGVVERFDEGHKSAEAAAGGEPKESAARPYGKSGLSDAAAVRAALEKSLAALAEQQTPFGLVHIELDQFEEFRKAHGGPAADRIWQTVAEGLARNLPKRDMLGQWEAGRFTAVLSDCPPVMLARAAGRLRQVAQAVSISWWGDRLSIPVWVGGTAARPDDTAELLLRRAELALRSSQKSGTGLEIS